MTTPVAFFGSTNSAGRIRISWLVTGFLTCFPTSWLPIRVSTTSTFRFRYPNFSTDSLLTIHCSLSTLAFTYSTVGFNHMLVTPKIVSGRRVAAGKIHSPYWNLISVNSPISGSTSSCVSCCPTGFPSFGHHPTGWLPWEM